MASPRTPKGQGTVFDTPLLVRFTKAQLAEVTKAAAKANLPRERFIRNTLVDAAKRILEAK